MAIHKENTRRTKKDDECYILDLCDKILELTSFRQYKFDFLRGDENRKGTARRLPVDGYYPTLNLVIEYRERQHTESIPFFDKPNYLTISGVHRGKQRGIYDERRRQVLPKHKIKLIEISYSDFEYNSQKRIKRNIASDLEIIKKKFFLSGVITQ